MIFISHSSHSLHSIVKNVAIILLNSLTSFLCKWNSKRREKKNKRIYRLNKKMFTFFAFFTFQHGKHVLCFVFGFLSTWRRLIKDEIRLESRIHMFSLRLLVFCFFFVFLPIFTFSTFHSFVYNFQAIAQTYESTNIFLSTFLRKIIDSVSF